VPRSDYWIKIFDSFPDHPKVRELRRRLHWNAFEARGFLVSFWLLVASDAPTGVLTGLATPDGLLVALGIAQADMRRKILDALVGVGLVDVDADGLYRIHDWESGGGQLQQVRQADASRQRRRRDGMAGAEEEAGKKGGEMENGRGISGAACHADVTPESKSKSNITPPNPPQAGGGFSEILLMVKAAWWGVCDRIGVVALDDAKTNLGAANFARQYQNGNITMPEIRQAMQHFADAKYGDNRDAAKMRAWTLDTLAKSPSAWIGKTPAAAVSGGKRRIWEFRCDVCGETAAVYGTEDNPPPEYPCDRMPKLHGKTCPGTLRRR
jgi:hypothetical protein